MKKIELVAISIEIEKKLEIKFFKFCLNPNLEICLNLKTLFKFKILILKKNLIFQILILEWFLLKWGKYLFKD